MSCQPAAGFDGVQTTSVWCTGAVPSKDNGDGCVLSSPFPLPAESLIDYRHRRSDGSSRVPDGDLGIVHRNGAHCMMTVLEPGKSVVMVRTFVV